MRRVQSFIAVFLLLIGAFESNGQERHPEKTQRIRVWYSVPSHHDAGSNLSSREGTPLNHDTTATSSSQSGYYIQVDTTTDGTHAIFTVTTTADTGVGSFAKAIEDANANLGLDYINFAIGSGPQTLAPHLPFGLPLIISPVVIDGTTQMGYPGTPIIELNGSNLGDTPGLVVVAGNSTVRGLVINRCLHAAIRLVTGGNNIIESNYIGINMAGNDSLPNQEGGIHILNSSNNRIGDTTSSARNVIAGNRAPHIDIEGSGSAGNVILGNYIGTDQSGLIDLSGETNGVRIFEGASNNTIGGLQQGAGNLISGCDFPDIFIGGVGTSFNVVQGNRIGSGALGLTAMENGNCIRISAGASDNLIGHTTIAGRNIISCSIIPYPGLVIDGAATTNNVVQGNIIGAPPSSTYDFGNSDGVFIANSPHNIIGGTSSGAANWISGNLGQGVLIGGSASTGNRIEGNLIGDPYIPGGPGLMGNYGSGIFINDAPGNIIGGRDPLDANTISANFQHGIVIRGDTARGNAVQGNFIGGQEDGVPNTSTRGNHGHGILLIASGDTIGGTELILGNTIVYNKQCGVYDSIGGRNPILHNLIYANDSMGIDLAPHGLTPNDSLDTDVGPNGLQNFPILDSARIIPGAIVVHGRLLSTPNTSFTIEFFKNTSRDRTLFGEGESWIGNRTVSTNVAGWADIDETLPFNILSTEFITANATDPDGNTSEFSRALCLKDTDGDGILDCWETRGDGIDWNADGIIDLDLSAEGAQPNHKDVFVEVDFMNPYRPSSSALSQVYSAFASVSNSFVNNPDGNNGINLHMELDAYDSVATMAWASNPWPQFDIEKALHFGTAFERADPNWKNIREARKLVYRYCIFADRFPTPTPQGITYYSGMTRTIPGNDFFVSLGTFNPSGGTSSQQAGTFMHELGHTLGLKHGGDDEVHYKLNYYSVMNYLFQLPQNLEPGTWRLGYSVAALPVLDELQLDERVGLDPPVGMFPKVKIPYTRPNGTIALALLYPNTAVDWNGNDTIGVTPVSVDINHFYPSRNLPTPGQTMHGYADWPNLKYNFRNSPGFPLSDHVDTLAEEMTPELYEYLLTLPPYGIESPLISWSSDPNTNIPISTASVTQGGPIVVGDGEGGAYIAWTHGSGVPSTSGVYAQKVDAFGALQWMNNGIPVAVGPENQGVSDFIADGEGNAIVSWVERRTGSFDIMAQKINQFGQGLWGSGGISIIRVLTTDVLSPWPRMKSDGQGGAIVVWSDIHLGTRSLFAQRINASGLVQWAPAGVRINTTPIYEASDFQVVNDGSNGVIIAWTDKRSGATGDIYAQRLSASGLVRWTANGVPICDASGHQAAPVIVSNGVGGAIVAWVNYRAGGNDIYAQQVDSLGQTSWITNGIAVVSVAGSKAFGGIVTDSSHGAIISWLDGRRTNYTDAYAQRINSAGVALWAANGVVISDTNLRCYESTIMSDNNRGAMVILARQNVFQGNKLNVFAQLIDSAGSIMWARNGVPITLANTPVPFQSVSATSDLAGGAIIAWQDGRTDTLGSGVRHIYAQNVTNHGGLGGGVTTGVARSPTSEVPSGVSLNQNYPNPFNPNTIIRYELPERSNVSLTVFNILGQQVASLVNGIEEQGHRQVMFNGANFASGVYFYRLVATGVVKGTQSTSVRKMILIK